MSGMDEVDIIPACPKCGSKIGYSVFIQGGRISTYNACYGHIENSLLIGTTVVPHLLLVNFHSMNGETISSYIERIMADKEFRPYGFRCKMCEYLFTPRRKKLHYLKLVEVMYVCFRRGFVAKRSSHRRW